MFAEGVLGGFVAARKLELGEDVAHVALDGVDADAQILGDLFVAGAGGHQVDGMAVEDFARALADGQTHYTHSCGSLALREDLRLERFELEEPSLDDIFVQVVQGEAGPPEGNHA